MCFYPHVSPNNKIRWVLSLAYTTNHATTLCANILLSKFSVLHSQLCSWQLKESKGVFGWWVDENGTVLFLFFGCLVSYGGRVERLLESLCSGIAQKSGWARSPKSSASAPVLPSLAKSNPSSVSTSLCSSISSPPWGAPPLWAPTSAPTFYRCREELFLCEHLPLLLHLADVVRSFAVVNLGESLPPLLLPSPDLFLSLPSTLHPPTLPAPTPRPSRWIRHPLFSFHQIYFFTGSISLFKLEVFLATSRSEALVFLLLEI